MNDNLYPAGALHCAYENGRVDERREILDKLEVFASASRNPSRLSREIVRKQCEDFLVEFVDQIRRDAFRAGFYATIDGEGGWQFNECMAADREPEAWNAYTKK